MACITLISDWGVKDFYVGIWKGVLYQELPGIPIVDITHEISPFQIPQAALALQSTFHAFPEGSLHWVSIEDRQQSSGLIAFQLQDHWFVGPDNGLFSLAFPQYKIEAYRLYDFSQNGQAASYKPYQAVAKNIHAILNGTPLSKLGVPVSQLKQNIPFQPLIRPDHIQGLVIYIDRYENVIVNIHQDVFQSVVNNKPFTVFYRSRDTLQHLSNQYHDVPIGERLCRFNASGFFEIAMNRGKAASLLGIRFMDTIKISFQS